MFERETVGVRIANIGHEQMDRDETEVALVKLTCEINPFTPELAGELHDKVKRTLYTATGAEVDSLVSGVAFDLGIRPQQVVFRMAPDQKKGSFTVDEAKVSGLKAKRSKKSTAWVLEFALTFAPTGKDMLAQAVDTYLKQRFLTFADAEPNLFDTRGDEARKHRKAVAEAEPDEEGNHEAESRPGLH